MVMLEDCDADFQRYLDERISLAEYICRKHPNLFDQLIKEMANDAIDIVIKERLTLMNLSTSDLHKHLHKFHFDKLLSRDSIIKVLLPFFPINDATIYANVLDCVAELPSDCHDFLIATNVLIATNIATNALTSKIFVNLFTSLLTC